MTRLSGYFLPTEKEAPADAEAVSHQLLVRAGQRHLRMKLKDLEHYVGQRALRGHKLPRGFQRVDGVDVESS